MDLDLVPPSENGDSSTISWDSAGDCPPGCIVAGGLDVSYWTASAPPGYSQCHLMALTHPLGGGSTANVAAQQGTQLCIITTDGHTVYLRVTGIDNSTGSAAADVIIWTG